MQADSHYQGTSGLLKIHKMKSAKLKKVSGERS